MKIALSLFVVALALGAYFFFSPFQSDEEGVITIEIHDENENLVARDEHPFDKDDSLFTVLDEHYEIIFEERYIRPGFSGKILLAIDGVETDFATTFIYIEKDGKKALYGIDDLPLEDGSVYTFRVRDVE